MRERLFKKLIKNERGNISLIFGGIFVTLVACVGVGYDMNQLVSTKQKASSIADTTALTAAIFYSTHNRLPGSNSEGFVHGQTYDASAVNYYFEGISNKQAEGVTITVTYDLDTKEATSVVEGRTQVAFMQIFGYDKLDFRSEAVAKFSEIHLKDPASIMFVLDNSGSMEFDDLPYGQTRNPLNARQPGTQKRLPALESSVRGMMAKLRAIMETEDGDPNGRNQRSIRTAMIPYSSNVLTDVDVPGQWGLLSNNQVNAMRYRTGTNSAPPLDSALSVMDAYTAGDPENEAKIHIDEHGDDPLRYVIFMTDGQNNGNFDIWDARADTGTWRRWGRHVRCSRDSNGYLYRDDDGPIACHYSSDRWIYVNNSPEEPEDFSGWEEGTFDNQSNLDSRSTCSQMHAAGVEVFTIAFGLQKGWFYTNAWGAQYGGGSYNQWEIKQPEVSNALSLMQFCATSPDHYTEAVDSQALNDAFDRIGDNIIKELIRIKS